MSNTKLALAFVALALAGCATTRPYAEVVGERANRADFYEEDVWVLGVDGRLDLSAQKTMMIEPGSRSVLLGTVRTDRRNDGASAVVPLNAKACLRYYFVAKHESMTLVQPWRLMLKNVEPIPECVAKFPEHTPVPAEPLASRPAQQ